MVTALFVLVGLLAAETGGGLGVVRSPRGEVYLINDSGESRPARVGAFVGVDQEIEVGEGGWAELLLRGDARLRLSSGTQIQLQQAPDGGILVELRTGRLWIQKSQRTAPALRVHAAGMTVEVLPTSSIIIEHTTLSGGSCIVRAGQARVTSDADAPIVVETGMIARRSRQGEARIGGQTIGDLVAKEARIGLGDLVGLTAFIVARTVGAEVADVDIRGVESLFHGDAQLMGGSQPSIIVERAVRPPPFEMTEIPARGANVEVEVRFEER